MSRRSDARTNRDAILRVADAAFVHEHDSPPLDEIARRTGLGRATVYRHFSDRHALATAVAAESLELHRRAATGADGERQSLRELLHTVLSNQVMLRPLAKLMRALPMGEQRKIAAELIDILTPPVQQAQAQGQLRSDFEPADLTLLLMVIDAAAEAEVEPFGANRPAAVARLLAVILDGLFCPNPSPAILQPTLTLTSRPDNVAPGAQGENSALDS